MECPWCTLAENEVNVWISPSSLVPWPLAELGVPGSEQSTANTSTQALEPDFIAAFAQPETSTHTQDLLTFRFHSYF